MPGALQRQYPDVNKDGAQGKEADDIERRSHGGSAAPTSPTGHRKQLL
jgi:hypothetical protein